MIKSAYDITIGDLARTEQTGEVRHFKKWFNILPSQLFVKKIVQTVDDIYKDVNNGKSEEFELIQKIDEQKYIINKSIEIQELEALDLIICNHLLNYVRLMDLKNRVKSRKLRKIKDNEHILRKGLSDVKEKTGIEINTPDDILKLRAIIYEKKERLQNFLDENSKENDGDKIGIITLVYRYLNYLKLSYEPEKIRVTHFLKLMKMADEQAKKELEQINKQKSA
jgi:hypothetical protein